MQCNQVVYKNMTTIRQANGGHGHIKGKTWYDAIRIIENDDGIFIKTDDAIFSRSSLVNNGDMHKDSFLPE